MYDIIYVHYVHDEHYVHVHYDHNVLCEKLQQQIIFVCLKKGSNKLQL